MYQDIDGESGDTMGLTSSGDFSEERIRKGFIRKLYGIVTIQLAVTMGIMGIFFAETVKEYTNLNIWVFWTAFFILIGLLIGLTCCGDVKRQSPHNIILLSVFTVAEGLMLGAACSTFNAPSLIVAIGICTLVALGLTLFASQNRIDFTTCNGLLFTLLLCLIIFGLSCAIFRSQIMNVVYASIGAAIFSCYIVVDAQLMMGGVCPHGNPESHIDSMIHDPDEYIFAALNLYVDIINLVRVILKSYFNTVLFHECGIIRN